MKLIKSCALLLVCILTLLFSLNSRADSVQIKSFQQSFNKVNDYYKRIHFWITRFDRNLAMTNEIKLKNGDSLNEGFLKRSREYKVLQLLRKQQEKNLDNFAEEYEDLTERKIFTDAETIRKINAMWNQWHKQYPLVFEQIVEHLSVRKNLNDNSTSFFRDETINFNLPNATIDEIQKKAAVQGEQIVNLENRQELQDLESRALVGTTALPYDEPSFEPTAVKKCIKPSLGEEGNITGSELPRDHWVFTFDDGPSPIYTEDFLKYLKDDGVKASFFMLTSKMKAKPNIVKEVDSQNHIIGGHSWSHTDLSKADEATLDREIIGSNAIHQKILNRKPKFFRCPYGAGYKQASIRQRLLDQKMIHVLWNVDTLDWQDKNPDTIVKRALNQMASSRRGVILFHDIHPQSLTASRELIKQLKANANIKLLTIEDAMSLINKNRGCSEGDLGSVF